VQDRGLLRPPTFAPQLKRGPLDGNKSPLMANSSKQTGFQCCFCGQTIAERGPDPVTLNIPLDGGGTQQLPCHAACLRRVLHPSVPLALP
jgi:hypothetical protein